MVARVGAVVVGLNYCSQRGEICQRTDMYYDLKHEIGTRIMSV